MVHIRVNKIHRPSKILTNKDILSTDVYVRVCIERRVRLYVSAAQTLFQNVSKFYNRETHVCF